MPLLDLGVLCFDLEAVVKDDGTRIRKVEWIGVGHRVNREPVGALIVRKVGIVEGRECIAGDRRSAEPALHKEPVAAPYHCSIIAADAPGKTKAGQKVRLGGNREGRWTPRRRRQ